MTRLPVLGNAAPGRSGAAAPPCGACSLQAVCWGHPRIDLRVLNLLVCRFERGIERDRTFRAILTALTPALAKLSRRTAKRARLSYAEVFGSLSTEVYLGLEAYLLGDAMGLFRWLFHPQRGCVWLAAERMVHGRVASREMPTGIADEAEDLEGRLAVLNRSATNERVRGHPELAPNSETEARDTTAVMAAVSAAMTAVDDGVTLTLGEYRTITFAMTWAREGARPVDGLFAYLARRWGVPKQSVQDQYTSAASKLIRATGMQAHVLRTRGFTVTPVGAPGAPAGVTVAALALALGCSSRVIYKHRARARAAAAAAGSATAPTYAAAP